MEASSIPYKFATPWGADAASGQVTNPIPATATGAAASQQQGFPLITATNPAAGGIPPSFADFNGFGLYMSLWLQWTQAGGPIKYDATFSSNIGGYPKGSVISSATLGGFWLSTVDNNATDPDTGGGGWVSPIAGRLLSVQSFGDTATYTPTAGTNFIIVTIVGGGGAGGGPPATGTGEYSLGSGGQAGATARGIFFSGFSGGLTATIGAGGNGNSGNYGNYGESSSLGSLISAQGGAGGAVAGPSSSSPINSVVASGGGIPAGGNIYEIGGQYGGGSSCNPPSGIALAGAGGSTAYGGGGAPNAGGTGFGSGGGGYVSVPNTSAVTGRAGHAGLIIIEEYS